MSKWIRYNEDNKRFEFTKEGIVEAYMDSTVFRTVSKGILVDRTATLQNADVGTLLTVQNVQAKAGAVATLGFARMQSGATVGAAGNVIDMLQLQVGTLYLINVATLSLGVGTLDVPGLGTGGVDRLLGNPKVALIANLGIGGLRVLGSGRANVDLINMAANSVGSQPSIGFDCFMPRAAS